VGAIRELIERMSQRSDQLPQLFITGGEAPQIVENIATSFADVRHIPNMVLAGIHVVARDLL
jgi:pantothenate kinase type III